MIEFTKKTLIYLALIIGILLILIPLLIWVGNDGLETTLVLVGIDVPSYPIAGTDLGSLLQQLLFGAIGILGVFGLAIALFYLFSSIKKE